MQLMDLKINDVRAEMPNYSSYENWQRSGPILGIAIHHSATADWTTGVPIGDAYTFFDYHVNQRGWAHGGYNYVITGAGEIQYALDEKIAAYHAGFADPDNSEGLEQGQYWNNHYLAICLSGWFSQGRTYRNSAGQTQPIPNNFTSPSAAQMNSLLALIQQLRRKYSLPVDSVRGHRELAGNATTCPGSNLDPAQLRAALRAADLANPETPANGEAPSLVNPGEHVMLLPDTDKYLNAAMAYIWKFQPDVSFAPDEARGRWRYVTAVGNPENISDDQLARLRVGGASFIQRIAGDPLVAQTTLDKLAETGSRFLTHPDPTAPAPAPPESWRTYTVQPGDTLSLIARQVYGQVQSWPIIFEANQDILSDPSRLRPGQVLKIPPKEE
jgi:LysM repeat protein